LVPKARVELAHPCGYMVLNHARLPFRHSGSVSIVYQTGIPLSTRFSAVFRRFLRAIPLILTVTPNAAVDKTYTVENFTIDRVHRPASWRIVAGGKGINVARVYAELGGDAMATGFLGGHNGDFIRESLRTEGMKHDMVHTAGESRVCIAVLDPVNKTQTELNEVGPEISREEVDLLKL
jgi:hypothetical protein